MKKLKIMSVFGTRPEAIKMAPLVKEIAAHPGMESLCCLTGQHREMLDSVMEIFRLRGDYDLNIMEQRQTLTTITTKTILGMDRVIEEAKPDMILVHGDTSTTFAGALSAFYHQVPVGHVEAGLRTYDPYSPYPEEMNRVLVSDLAELHFAPTRANAENLRKEAVRGEIFITGNTAIDAMKTTVRDDFQFSTPELNCLDFAARRVIVVTCHRRENYGAPMEHIMHAIRDVAETHSDVEVVYPVHLSPKVRECAFGILGGVPRVHLTDPVNVEEMHNLMARCYMVMTDSGGLQEEAPALGKPVLVMRRETERPEAVAAGTARLAGVEREIVARMAAELLDEPAAYTQMARAVNPYGDGSACARIVGAIAWRFGLTAERPADFQAES
ncbi:MAG: UDP-N-acetylglucosamine 2-epimerase (non-hydrolyzing) [Oscillospiraceae bacterium]|nr:UDP-N-acetylglucosamine 2-epimerase (non-hydrolyzing) [Oscillospiraceae bacterium]